MIYAGTENEVIDGFQYIREYMEKNGKKKMPNNFNCVGLTFNYLTIIGEAGMNETNTHKVVKVRCKCGKEKEISLYHITKNRIKSCGCYKDRNKDERHKIAYSAMKQNKRLYRSFDAMKRRCYDPKIKAYKYYGARGIKVCDEWKKEGGFTDFYFWAMENGYSDDLTLDRIDVNGNYEPSNCRWVTMRDQVLNRRNTLYYEFIGETKPLAEWAKIFNVERKIVDLRYYHGDRKPELLFVKRRENMITPALYQNAIKEHIEEMETNPESAKKKMIADTVTVMKQFGYDCGVEELLDAFNLRMMLRNDNGKETE